MVYLDVGASPPASSESQNYGIEQVYSPDPRRAATLRGFRPPSFQCPDAFGRKKDRKVAANSVQAWATIKIKK